MATAATSAPKTSRLKKGAAVTLLALVLVGGFEGLRPKAYLDIVSVPTICFGSTKGVRLGMEMTRPECEALLVTDLVEHEHGMRNCLRAPDALPDKAYVAFLSVTFNIGVGAFCGSTMARKINAGEVAGACDALLMWDRAGGKQIAGLTRRRHEERDYCHAGLRGEPFDPWEGLR